MVPYYGLYFSSGAVMRFDRWHKPHLDGSLENGVPLQCNYAPAVQMSKWCTLTLPASHLKATPCWDSWCCGFAKY